MEEEVKVKVMDMMLVVMVGCGGRRREDEQIGEIETVGDRCATRQRGFHGKNRDKRDSISTGDSSSPPSVEQVGKLDGGQEILQTKRGDEKHDNFNSYRSDCFSRSNVDVAKEGEVLDDWDSVADALNIQDVVPPSRDMKDSSRSNSCKLDYGVLLSDLEANNASRGPLHQTNNSAWRSGDVFRPQNLPSINTNYNRVLRGTLPNIGKQHARVVNSRHDGARGGATWSWTRRAVAPEQPTSCPICCEDLDLTDRCFRPCPCGFQVCLFCHKRIREDDGRCPGCRKQYEAIDIETYFMTRAHLGMRRRFMS
ncbi:General negative regulator of transcription subunit 4-like protein [Drosera capensis]